MDISSLKTFLEVYKTRHFGRAASNLFVTQSAVSARIRQLEAKLGVQLFTRDRNNIQPTDAGKKFYAHAESILNAWNRAQLNLALEDDKRTHVAVAGIPSLWDPYLGEWLLNVNEQFPGVVITAEALSNEIISQRLTEGIIDIGLSYEPPLHASIKSAKRIPINLIMVSTSQDTSAEHAVNEDYIYVDWGTSFAAAHASYFDEAPIPPLSLGIARIALEFIKYRGGSAYLPESMVKASLDDHTLYRVEDAPVIHREAHFIYRKGNDRQKLLSQLIEEC